MPSTSTGEDSPAHRLFASIIADLAPTNNPAAEAEAEDGDEAETETMSPALPPLKTIFDCDMIEKGIVINDNDKVGWRCLWCGNNFFPVHATRALFHVLKMKQGGIAICNGVVDEAHLQRYRLLHQSLAEKPSKARKRSAAEEDDDGDVEIIDNDHPPSSATKAKRSRPTATSKLRNKKQHIVDKKLIEPYHYINATPGKDVRGKLIDCFQLWLNVPQLSILNDIKTIVADLHNASLLIDDIEDNSKLRRGVPVAHSIFGVPSVINTANYVYFLALERCMSLGNDDAMKVFVREMLNLHRGQGYDIQWRDSSTCPTETQYISMVTDKTGGLFRLAVGLLQCFSTTNRDVNFVPLVNNLGLYFQIRDDLINLADEEYMKSKSFCEDLTEGKFSLPIIHCIRCGDTWNVEGGGGGKATSSSSLSAQLLSILKQRTEDVDVKRYAQRLLSDAGSLRYTREKCTELRDSIVSQIQELGGNEPLMKVIHMLDVQLQTMAESDGKTAENGASSVTRAKSPQSNNEDDDTTSPAMKLDYM